MSRVVHLENSPVFCLVDEADFDLVRARTWRRARGGAVTGNPGKDEPRLHSVLMHRLITKAPKGVPVKHRNGDLFDNRRENLLVGKPTTPRPPAAEGDE